MNCNDCCRPIEHCACSLWGGKVTTNKLRVLERKQREFWTGKPAPSERQKPASSQGERDE